jgi:2-C-methyl-D-erythritol 4-phosphate cytidylyltransferase
MRPRYWAVVAAAGGGARMGVKTPKQYLPACGKTLVEHSLAVFLELGWIEGVVVVIAPGDTQFRQLPCAAEPRVRLAAGGATRADSVLAGLALLPNDPQNLYVLVHDAARPCVTRADIERLRDEATDEQGGLLAVPQADTLKRAEERQVRETVDRRGLWCAQTPQMFRADSLRQALQAAAGRGAEVTDEASAMEAAGFRPHLVPGRRSNIKVTYAEDLALAEFWLSRPENQR